MDTFLNGFGTLTSYAFLVLVVAIVGAAIFAVVHAARTPAQAFEITGKWQKNYWIITLVVCVLLALALPGGMGLVIGAIGSLVYLLDVRPKVDEVRRPRY